MVPENLGDVAEIQRIIKDENETDPFNELSSLPPLLKSEGGR